MYDMSYISGEISYFSGEKLAKICFDNAWLLNVFKAQYLFLQKIICQYCFGATNLIKPDTENIEPHHANMSV